MTPIDLTQSILLAVALAGAGYAALRKRNHIEKEMRAELDVALAENKRLASELSDTRAALHDAAVKVTPEVLAKYAAQAVAYAEQMGGTGAEKLTHALQAAQKLDAGDNGKRDWSDAQLRIAIEAALSSKQPQHHRERNHV